MSVKPQPSLWRWGLPLLREILVHFEAWLIDLAAQILIGRNVARSDAVSRADNNRMFEMGFALRQIAERMRKHYDTKSPVDPT